MFWRIWPWWGVTCAYGIGLEAEPAMSPVLKGYLVVDSALICVSVAVLNQNGVLSQLPLVPCLLPLVAAVALGVLLVLTGRRQTTPRDNSDARQ